MKIISQQTYLTGFTLLEMVISIGIFAVMVVASIDIMLSVSNAQKKSANTQSVQDNIRFSLELITKEMRTGRNFETSFPRCGPSGSEIRFDATSGKRVYFYDATNKRIMRAKEDINPSECSEANGKVVQFTGEDVYIERFDFITQGINAGPSDGHPMITIALRARSEDKKTQLETAVDIQTTIVQRVPDINP